MTREKKNKEAQEQQSSTSFRSILPHEPLPPKESYKGYLLLQGSFQVHKQKAKNERSKEKVNSISKDACMDYLWNTFGTISSNPSTTDTEHICNCKPPYKCESIEIVNDTKIQLIYKNNKEARYVFYYMRYYCFSPFDVLAPFVCSSPDNNDVFAISKKALQITQVIPRSYDIEHEIDRIHHWPRVSPPKFRRLILTDESQHPQEKELLQKQRGETRYLYCSGFVSSIGTGSDTWKANLYSQPILILEILRRMIEVYDTSLKGVEIWLQPTSKNKVQKFDHVYIGMRSHEDAWNVMRGLSNTIQSISYEDGGAVWTTDNLFLDWADTITPSTYIKKQSETPGEPSKSECTSLTNHITIPGLVLVENFITEEEENMILGILSTGDAPWAPKQTRRSGGNVKRRVQHYGYIFDYVSSDVIRAPKDFIPPPLPATELERIDGTDERHDTGWSAYASAIQRLRSYTAVPTQPQEEKKPFETLNQITLNEYLPGQGIGSHIDTPSAFTNGLASLSLSSGCVMEFKLNDIRKLVYLPPRSILILTDDARYKYTHAITGRMTDTVDGQVIPRSTRYSLTFRTALDRDGISILPCRTTTSFPLKWVFLDKTNPGVNPLQTPHCEKYHVQAVYDAIATQWTHTRSKRGVLWPCVVEFLQALPRYSIIADVGCGDGKYFSSTSEEYLNQLMFLGCDMSLPLLQTIPSNIRNKHNTIVADCMNLPFSSNSFDAAICIAVFHHISTYNRRLHVIQELKRITRNKGYIHIQAWAKEQDCSKEEGKKLNKHKSIKKNFTTSDVFVPFHVQPRYLTKVASSSDTTKLNHAHDCQKNTNPTTAIAEQYAKAYEGAEYNEMKNLVVFQRYCHMYTSNELDQLIQTVGGLIICESGYEAGNYFVVVQKNVDS